MRALVTGGAGFVGSNYAHDLLDKRWDVTIYDNLARGKGCKTNLQWLTNHPNAKELKTVNGDVNSFQPLQQPPAIAT